MSIFEESYGCYASLDAEEVAFVIVVNFLASANPAKDRGQANRHMAQQYCGGYINRIGKRVMIPNGTERRTKNEFFWLLYGLPWKLVEQGEYTPPYGCSTFINLRLSNSALSTGPMVVFEYIKFLCEVLSVYT